MTTTRNSGDTGDRRSERFQFGLATLLWLTLAVACAMALLVTTPPTFAVPILICLSIAVPAVLTTALIYRGGYVRAFCTGALFPTGIFLLANGWILVLTLACRHPPTTIGEYDFALAWTIFFEETAGYYRIYAGTAWFLGLIVGLICIAVRRLALSGSHKCDQDAPRSPS